MHSLNNATEMLECFGVGTLHTDYNFARNGCDTGCRTKEAEAGVSMPQFSQLTTLAGVQPVRGQEYVKTQHVVTLWLVNLHCSITCSPDPFFRAVAVRKLAVVGRQCEKNNKNRARTSGKDTLNLEHIKNAAQTDNYAKGYLIFPWSVFICSPRYDFSKRQECSYIMRHTFMELRQLPDLWHIFRSDQEQFYYNPIIYVSR